MQIFFIIQNRILICSTYVVHICLYNLIYSIYRHCIHYINYNNLMSQPHWNNGNGFGKQMNLAGQATTISACIHIQSSWSRQNSFFLQYCSRCSVFSPEISIIYVLQDSYSLSEIFFYYIRIDIYIIIYIYFILYKYNIYIHDISHIYLCYIYDIYIYMYLHMIYIYIILYSYYVYIYTYDTYDIHMAHIIHI